MLPKIPHTDVYKIMYEKILNDSSGRWMCSVSSVGVQVSFLEVSSFSFKKCQEVRIMDNFILKSQIRNKLLQKTF